MTSRPDRALAQVDIDLCDETSVAGVAPLTLMSDDRDIRNAPHTASLTSVVTVRISPRATTSMNKYWFNPSWIEEDAVPGVDHGEFQSPVWLAVSMTMRADRERELNETHQRRVRRSGDHPHAGQLRMLLSFVNTTTRAAAAHHESDTSTMGRTVNAKPVASSRYHELAPRSAPQPRRFIHFISSSLNKVSVIHN